MRAHRSLPRWVLLALLLAAGWAGSGAMAPLYDGVGFPDQPYRFVPPPAGPALPPAASARVRLSVLAGVNTGGLIANSAELGPQVSVYAPPGAFRVAGAGRPTEVVLLARPVPLTGAPPTGTRVSNVYELSFTSPAGRVAIDPAAQEPAITLRAASSLPGAGLQYRTAEGSRWRPLRTRQVGADIYTGPVPAAGQYALARAAGAPGNSSSRFSVYVVLVAGGLLALLLLAVRLRRRR